MSSRILVIGAIALLGLSNNLLAQDMTPGTVFSDCETCPEMVVVPAGSFTMGSPSNEPGHEADELPLHDVYLARDFAVGRYEVTVGQFREFIEETRHRYRSGCYRASWRNPGYRQSDQHAVSCLVWVDVQAFISWLSEKTGQPYRLLTEAEWEYAARSGTDGMFHWNGAARHDLANYAGTGGVDIWRRGAAPVGSFPSNGFGLFDMHGNVWEWVQDCARRDYTNSSTDGSVWTFPTCATRGQRGGSWDDHPNDMRSANRHWNTTRPGGASDAGYGFRLARDLVPAETARPNEEEPE